MFPIAVSSDLGLMIWNCAFDKAVPNFSTVPELALASAAVNYIVVLTRSIGLIDPLFFATPALIAFRFAFCI